MHLIAIKPPKGDGEDLFQYDETGRANHDSTLENDLDIVNVPERIQRDVWLCVFPTHTILCSSEETASMVGSGCIGIEKHTINIPKGHGLEKS